MHKLESIMQLYHRKNVLKLNQHNYQYISNLTLLSSFECN